MIKRRKHQQEKKEVLKPISKFQQAVESTADIATGYRPGLQALENQNRKFIEVDPLLLNGSVDIDSQVKALYPEEARWDYVIGYKDVAYFVEVHPASTASVSTMLAKAKWLEQWLKENAPLLQQMRKDNQLYWVPSGNCKILKGSPQAKKLAKSRLKIVNPLKL